MTDREPESLTIYRLLEIMIGLVTIFGPMVGVVWYFESRLDSLNSKISNNERLITCLIHATINDVKPIYCSGE